MKVRTLFGRVRPIPTSQQEINPRARRAAPPSYPLQGTAADLIKIAMIGIDTALREAD